MKEPKRCVRCEAETTLPEAEARKLGWRFHGRLTYCPEHKSYQFSLSDRDA